MEAAPGLIARKRDGGELDAAELSGFVTGFLEGGISEGQMAALLMAGVLRGFTESEALALTRILLDSGERLDLSSLRGPTVDKHSTGGVADGTTLLVVPLLVAAGAQVVKLSGRGLGFTGGTLDKLESIPGLRVQWEPEEMRRLASAAGAVIAAQSDRLVPADRALYALRNDTGTVASAALVASSVMAKKLAGGAESIVLDVKTGRGAFMADRADAEALAGLCVRIAADAGRRAAAVVSRMDQPLGRAVGNALEIRECVELLSGPPRGRMADLALDLAAQAWGLAAGEDVAAARTVLADLWARGAALERLAAIVEAQGGDPAVCEHPEAVLPAAPVVVPLIADADGHVGDIDARAIGEAVVALGAGRTRKEQAVDPAVGVVLLAEAGAPVGRGDPLAEVHAREDAAAGEALRSLRGAIPLTAEAFTPQPTVVSWHDSTGGGSAGVGPRGG